MQGHSLTMVQHFNGALVEEDLDSLAHEVVWHRVMRVRKRLLAGGLTLPLLVDSRAHRGVEAAVPSRKQLIDQFPLAFAVDVHRHARAVRLE